MLQVCLQPIKLHLGHRVSLQDVERGCLRDVMLVQAFEAILTSLVSNLSESLQVQAMTPGGEAGW